MQPIKSEILARLNAESQAGLMNIADRTGLSWQGLQKLRLNPERDPRFSTIARLARYYRLRASDFDNDSDCAA